MCPRQRTGGGEGGGVGFGVLSCKTLVSSPILLYFEIDVINVYNKIKMIEWEGTPCISLPLLKPPMTFIF